MGYNAKLYSLEPIQLVAFNFLGTHHTFISDRLKHQFKCGAPWKKHDFEIGKTYLAEFHFRPGGKTTSNYIINAAREISNEEAVKVNPQLYELMLQRAAINISIDQDPIFIEARSWINNEPINTQVLRKEWDGVQSNDVNIIEFAASRGTYGFSFQELLIHSIVHPSKRFKHLLI